MAKSKLTLLVDGNWLLISRLSVLQMNIQDDFQMCQELKSVLIKSLNVILRTFPEIDNIIFCADGGTWRSKLRIPQCLHHEEFGAMSEYKGTREKSDDINWDLVFTTFEEFITILGQSGITTCREREIEGDDWMWWWSTHLNADGTNCIIWSNDNDLKQLVKMDKNKCFTAWWNKKPGLFIDARIKEDEFDFMMNYEFNENEHILDKIKQRATNVSKIDPSNIVIEKILKGDISDNIIPIMLRKAKSGDSNKRFKISTKDVDYQLEYYSDDKVMEYLTNLYSSKSYDGRVVCSLPEVVEHFKYNRQLVALEEKSYPKEVLDTLKNYDDYMLSKDISIAESQIYAQKNSLGGVLDII